MIKDIQDNVLTVGDNVYYARPRGYKANAYLSPEVITKIENGFVYMGKKCSTSPNDQLIKV